MPDESYGGDAIGSVEPILEVVFECEYLVTPGVIHKLPEDCEPDGYDETERKITNVSIDGVELPPSLVESLAPYLRGCVDAVDLERAQKDFTYNRKHEQLMREREAANG